MAALDQGDPTGPEMRGGELAQPAVGVQVAPGRISGDHVHAAGPDEPAAIGALDPEAPVRRSCLADGLLACLLSLVNPCRPPRLLHHVEERAQADRAFRQTAITLAFCHLDVDSGRVPWNRQPVKPGLPVAVADLAFGVQQ